MRSSRHPSVYVSGHRLWKTRQEGTSGLFQNHTHEARTRRPLVGSQCDRKLWINPEVRGLKGMCFIQKQIILFSWMKHDTSMSSQPRFSVNSRWHLNLWSPVVCPCFGFSRAANKLTHADPEALWHLTMQTCARLSATLRQVCRGSLSLLISTYAIILLIKGYLMAW